MPKSSPLKMKVISALVKSLSPSKKRNIFSDAWKKLFFNPERPSKVIQTRKVKYPFYSSQMLATVPLGKEDTT